MASRVTREMLASENLPRASSFCAVLKNSMSNSALSPGSSTRSAATVAIPAVTCDDPEILARFVEATAESLDEAN